MPRALGAVLLLTLAALAGCSGGQPGGDAASPEGTAPTATTGVLRGVVVDDAIRPLEAVVSLQPTGLNASTVDGAFAFEGLAPGSYLVAAAAEGYTTIQTTASVLAGDASEVRVVLPRIVVSEPYPITYEFEGFVQASSGLLGAVVTSADPTGMSQCKCSFEAAAEPGVSRLVLEATWDDWQADPTGPTEYIWQVEAVGANASVQGTGPAPIHRVLGSLDFPAQGFALGNASAFRVNIYPDAVWPAVAQQYSAFLTLWYRGPPPEGWSVIQDP